MSWFGGFNPLAALAGGGGGWGGDSWDSWDGWDGGDSWSNGGGSKGGNSSGSTSNGKGSGGSSALETATAKPAGLGGSLPGAPKGLLGKPIGSTPVGNGTAPPVPKVGGGLLGKPIGALPAIPAMPLAGGMLPTMTMGAAGLLPAMTMGGTSPSGDDGGDKARKGGKGIAARFLADKKASGKGDKPEEDTSADWECKKCGARNFARRKDCFKCNAAWEPGPGEEDEKGKKGKKGKGGKDKGGKSKGCFNCGGDHQARDCPEGKKCYNCGGDHAVRDCTATPKCRLCDGEHFTHDCELCPESERKGKKGEKGKKGKGKGKKGRKGKEAPLPAGPTVYVSGLSYDTTTDTLLEHFKQAGEIVDGRVLMSRKGKGKGKGKDKDKGKKGEGKSRGTGLIVFKDEEIMKKAIETLNDTELEGRRLFVREYTEREEEKLDFSALLGDGDMTLLDDEDEGEGEGEGDEEWGGEEGWDDWKEEDGEWKGEVKEEWPGGDAWDGGSGGEGTWGSGDGGWDSAGDNWQAGGAANGGSAAAPPALAPPTNSGPPPPQQAPRMSGGSSAAARLASSLEDEDGREQASAKRSRPMSLREEMAAEGGGSAGGAGGGGGGRGRPMTLQEELAAEAAAAGVDASQASAQHSLAAVPDGPLQLKEAAQAEGVKILDAQGNEVPGQVLGSFDECPFPQELKDRIHRAGFDKPSQIQAYTWPLALQGYDIVGVAATGSGKTVAFLFPVFVHILKEKIQPKDPVNVCLAPTRELAVQIENEANKFGTEIGIVTVCTYGGAPKGPQADKLRRGCHIVVATPGRLNDFLEAGNDSPVKLDKAYKVTLDEADRMLDMGFEPQIRKILKLCPEENRHTLFFTATWEGKVRQLAMDFLKNPYQVKIGDSDVLKANDSITQFIRIVEPDRKVKELIKVFLKYNISERGRGDNRALVFCNSKKMCDQLEEGLNRARVRCDSIHGDKDQRQRETAMEDLREGRTKILCCTDVAARGLDIKGVTLVVNYDPPKHGEDYVHRIGRTGRAGQKGTAVTFLEHRDDYLGRQIRTIMQRSNQDVPKELDQLINGTLPRPRRRSRSRRSRSRRRRSRSRSRRGGDRRRSRSRSRGGGRGGGGGGGGRRSRSRRRSASRGRKDGGGRDGGAGRVERPRQNNFGDNGGGAPDAGAPSLAGVSKAPPSAPPQQFQQPSSQDGWAAPQTSQDNWGASQGSWNAGSSQDNWNAASSPDNWNAAGGSPQSSWNGSASNGVGSQDSWNAGSPQSTWNAAGGSPQSSYGSASNGVGSQDSWNAGSPQSTWNAAGGSPQSSYGSASNGVGSQDSWNAGASQNNWNAVGSQDNWNAASSQDSWSAPQQNMGMGNGMAQQQQSWDGSMGGGMSMGGGCGQSYGDGGMQQQQQQQQGYGGMQQQYSGMGGW
eukprot:TRINITY_DN21953_c0_g3_i2.p1 TRINITY_DN21953_c0_g3~~TRINITY_DN21953_c0_g3_i2.p1  ORF type:complete len:1405 (+),score=417.47 TRINITY_DN21953_c0_g3_i2:99-4313(+)